VRGPVRPGLPGRHPAGLAALPAYAIPLAVCIVAGRAGSVTRLAVEVTVLAVVAAVVGFEAGAAAGPVVVGSSVLSLNGFAVHEYGRLGWEPRTDLLAAAVLAAAWAIGYLTRRTVPLPAAGARLPEGTSDERRDLRRAHRGAVRRAGPRAARAGAARRRRPEPAVSASRRHRAGAPRSAA